MTTQQKEALESIGRALKISHSGAYSEPWVTMHQYLHGEIPALPQSPDFPVFLFMYRLIPWLEAPSRWTDFDHRVVQLIDQMAAQGQLINIRSTLFQSWASAVWTRNPDQKSFDELWAVLKNWGLTEQLLWNNVNDHFILADATGAPTALGKFTLAYVRANNPVLELDGKEKFGLFDFLLQHEPEYLILRLEPFLKEDRYCLPCSRKMLQKDALRYAPVLIQAMNRYTLRASAQFGIFESIYNALPEQYETEFRQAIDRYVDQVRSKFSDSWFYYEYDPEYQLAILKVFLYWWILEPAALARDKIDAFMRDCPHVKSPMIHALYEHYGKDSFPLLLHILNKTCRNGSGHREFLQFLKTIAHPEIYPQLWEFTRSTQKTVRTMVAAHLFQQLGEAAQPGAEALLADKKAEFRLTGALLLGLVKTDSALKALQNALAVEKNDDARDGILEALDGVWQPGDSPQAIAELVAQARSRGKLDKVWLPWLDGQTLPPLGWQDSGAALDPDTVQFLLYRMSRSKNLRPDVEARPLLQRIDRSKSAAFGKILLKGFFDAGADSKYKWCLTLGAMLGGPDEIELLRRKVQEFAEGKHRIHAENIVRALALNGTNKALRWIEFFSRKYQSKSKNVGEAAEAAFQLAAEEQGVSVFELADATIPDFGFEGLFREFDADGQTYRAFIDADFKLAFLNENNRLSKTPPKGTSAELQAELKEIGKEIRDIVKSQSGRMEQYLILQRKWPTARWDAFFRGNPVMFTYAIRLVWGLYDEQNQLVQTFLCLEDQSLVDRNGDEWELPEAGNIGMVHPLQLTADEKNYWKNYLFDLGVSPVFPQLERPVLPLSETNRNKTIITDFAGIQLACSAFTGFLQRRGWFRGSVVDGGSVSSYWKDFRELGVMAILMQTGELNVASYDGTAELGDLMFVQSGSVKHGGYLYDEPHSDSDPRLVRLGQLPPIIYSEVMADMDYFKQYKTAKT